MNETALLLHEGQLAHFRHAPFKHRFAYRMWMVSVDLDHFDEIQNPLFAHNSFAPVSLHDVDHGPRDASGLAEWTRAQLNRAGLDDFGASIRFMAIPRLFGWAFNPIAFFFCRDASGRLGAMLHQVKNTFGDQHVYVVPVVPPERPGERVHQRAGKKLHVSPFFDMNGGYQFSFRAPDFRHGSNFDLRLEYGTENGPLLTARLRLNTRPATTGLLLKLLIRQPLMAVKVMIAIHWQALRLWRRGAKFHSAPAATAEPASLESVR